MWIAAGGNLHSSVATGYFMTWMPTYGRFEITNTSNSSYFATVSNNNTVGIYDTATSQWVHWSANDNAASQDYGPITGVQVFKVYVSAYVTMWYINALP